MNDYELIDFGTGRKLERFGPYLLDRPAPHAPFERQLPWRWPEADARFDSSSAGQQGTWHGRLAPDTSWIAEFESLRLEMRLTPYGQVGVFPEQSESWRWLRQVAHDRHQPLKVLNLFAYTGASSLAAARAGAEVVHVDAARTAVAWARRNAAESGLADAPIRWIVDDCWAFVRRELRRNNSYDALILDPPSFGRGPRGQRWQIEEHFDALLQDCRQLLTRSPAFCLATCHTTGWSPGVFSRRVRKQLQPDPQWPTAEGWLELATSSNRTLQSGMFVRWSRE